MKPKPKGDFVATTVRVPRDMWTKVQHRAIDDGVGTGELILNLLSEYLKKGGSR